MKPYLVGVNGFFMAAVLVLAFLVDGNGNFPGLNDAASTAVSVGVFVAAFLSAGLLILRGRGRARGLGAALAILYVAMLLPLVLP